MTDSTADLSAVSIALLRGVVYREDDPARWQELLRLQSRVRDYVYVLGLELLVDEAEGWAFLRQRSPAAGEPELPRLVARRPLSYPVSLVLALLRRRLAEHDARSGESRLVLTRAEVEDLVRVFFAGGTDEARFRDRLDQHLEKVVQLGFLRRLAGAEESFEVRRILKAFVDAQWLGELDARLLRYREQAAGKERSE